MKENKEKMKITQVGTISSREEQVFAKRADIEFSGEVKEIDKEISKDCCNVNLWMKRGLGLSKQMLFREAVEAYSMAISIEPFNGLLYRHRGHRLLSSYRFKEGMADFELSSRLDPNNWDTWYHLGLSYYLLGDYKRAEKSFFNCFDMTDPSDEAYVAIVNWSYLNFMELGKKDEAEKIIKTVNKDTEAGENFAYKEMVLVYKGDLSYKEALDIDFDYKFAEHEFATKGYGISRYLKFIGETDKSSDLLKDIIEKDKAWAAFGYLAAYCQVNNKKRGNYGLFKSI